MKLSLSWLKTYVLTRLTPKQIAERLTMAGLEVGTSHSRGGDVVLDCEVTPNRPDWLSHMGVARELAALTGARLKHPKVRVVRGLAGAKPPSVILKDTAACKRYVGILVEGVQVKPSPGWLVKRLEAIGQRPINNIVDVTNFVLMETGQPLHAFDLGRLSGEKIVVRRAKSGETIQTLDDAKYKLDPSILVIADGKQPVALAGIKGGKAAEITQGTKRILIESAWFDPVTVRRASRKLGIASDSSYRFERTVDFEGVLAAAHRAANLMTQVAGGKVISLRDARVGIAKPSAIAWDPDDVKALGVEVPAKEQKSFFTRLGCQVKAKGHHWKVTPPTFRKDLTQPADLLEEVARFVGYEKIPVTLPRAYPPKVTLHPKAQTDLRAREQQVRRALLASGLDEMLSYSLVDPEILKRLHVPPGSWVKLKNPLSVDRSTLRPTLALGALEAVAWNLNRRLAGVSFFELGQTYHRKDGQPPEERRSLSVVLAGQKPITWGAKSATWSLFDAKGVLDGVARAVGAQSFSWKALNHPLFVAGSGLVCPGALLGVIDPKVAETLGVPREAEVVYAEVEWPRWWGRTSQTKRFQAISKILPVRRDFAIEVAENVSHGEIAEAAQAAGGPRVRDIQLFDCYRGKPIPKGKKSLAYTVVYHAKDAKLLVDAEVDATHQKILKALSEIFHARPRT